MTDKDPLTKLSLNIAGEYLKVVPNPEIELEVRIQHLDFAIWKQIYETLIKRDDVSGSIDESTTLIVSNKTSNRRTESFHKGVESEKVPSRRMEVTFRKGLIDREYKYLQKEEITSLFHKEQKFNFKASLAKEIRIASFITDLANKARIRLRASLIIDEIPDWRFDFTVVQTVHKQNFNTMTKLRQRMFPEGKEITINNYLENIPDDPDLRPTFELEAEFIGKVTTDTTAAALGERIRKVINFLLSSVNVETERIAKYQEKIYDMAHYLLRPSQSEHFRSHNSLKQLGNQPQNLTRETWHKLVSEEQLTNYYLSDKADGDRIFLYITPNPAAHGAWSAFAVTTNTFYDISDSFKKKFNNTKDVYIFDAEAVFRAATGSGPGPRIIEKIYLFDVLLWKNVNLCEKSFIEREKHLEEAEKLLQPLCEKKIQSRFAENTETSIASNIKKVYERKRLYPIDGLIFTPTEGGYFDMTVYKWKPPERISIDFLVMPLPTNLRNIAPYYTKPHHDLLLLFTGINRDVRERLNLTRMPEYDNIFKDFELRSDYFPIQFSLPVNPKAYIYYHPHTSSYKTEDLVGHVVEFRHDYEAAAKAENPVPEPEEIIDDLDEEIAPTALPIKEKKITPLNTVENFWVIDRIRLDKDLDVQRGTGYGNNFTTAESTYNDMMHPLTYDMLLHPHKTEPTAASKKTSNKQGKSVKSAKSTKSTKPITKKGGKEEDVELDESEEKEEIAAPDTGYFAESKSDIYKAPTKFNNFVKAQVLRQLENANWVVDLASGRGGHDMFVYNSYQVKNVIFTDRDAEALRELNKRRYNLHEAAYHVYGFHPKHELKLYTLEMDLTKPAAEVLDAMKKFPLPVAETENSLSYTADAVVINFAIHYLIHDPQSLENLVTLVDSLLKPGGIFIFTCFSGARIFNMLCDTATNASWDLHENGVLKYSIKKLYKSRNLTDFGQEIGVIHPFSKGQYYTENLVNLEVVVKAFQEKNFVLRQNSSFGDWIDRFKRFNRKMFDALTEDDLIYNSLYHYVSLWKAP